MRKPAARTGRLRTWGRTGSASLVLAVVVGACLVVFSIFLQGARMRAAESGLLRAVTSSADGAVSAYSGVLLQRYGLFAFDSDDVAWKARAEGIFRSGLPGNAKDCALALRPDGSLADPGILQAGIRRFVLERVPALLLSRGIGSWSGLARQEGVVSFDPLFDTGGEGDGASSEWQTALLHALENGDSPAETSVRSPDDADYGMGDASRDLRDSLVALESLNRDAAGDPTSPGLPSPLDPDALGGFLDRTLESLPDSVEKLVDTVTLDAYAASMFRSRVTESVESGATTPYRDLRGRNLSTIATVRTYEVEFLIVGHEADEANRTAVERRILALRLALQLLSQTVDEEARSRARAFGAALSALLSVATSGSLDVPQEFLAAAIQVAWAYGSAQADTKRLVEGASTPLLPAALGRSMPELASVKAAYGDYLVLFLAMTPDSVKLDRIASTIEDDLALFGGVPDATPGRAPLAGFCTSVLASTVYRGDGISAVARYGDVAP